MFEHLEKQFGLALEEQEIKPPKGLPVYMTSGRKMCRLSFDGGSFIAVCISEMDRFGVVALKKQQEQYEKYFDSNIAFSFSELTKVQRDSLIKHAVPFIAVPHQIYLPFLGMMLTDIYKKEKTVSVNKMMPATQSLFLYLLYKKGEAVSKMAAADELKLSRMSISRASEQLDVMGLIVQENVGRNTFVKLKKYGVEGYKLAEPYLINPVQRTITVKVNYEITGLPLAGETALSQFSMLGEPTIQTKAIIKDSEIISALEETNDKWDSDSQIVKLQLWKYDPCLFSKTGIVDAISLITSFENNSDERIEDALESCMEGLDD